MQRIKLFFSKLLSGVYRLDFSRAYYITQQSSLRTNDMNAFKFSPMVLYKRYYIHTVSGLHWARYTRIWTPIMINMGDPERVFTQCVISDVSHFRRLKKITDAYGYTD